MGGAAAEGAGEHVMPFGDWVLHPRTGALVHAGAAGVTLRPKTAAVLAELLATPGVLVTREAMLDRVWPGVTVTDDSLTQCVTEIRRALGKDAKLLRTAPRRGYVLDAPEPALPGPPAPATLPSPRSRVGGRHWAAAGVLVAAAVAGAVLALVAGRQARGPEAALRLMHEGRAVFSGPGDRRQVWPQAQALFLRAHEAAPDSPEPDAWAAFTYTNMVSAGYSADPAADLREAERLADQAVAHAPEMGLVWAARGGVFKLQGRAVEALEAYRRAVALDPTQLPSKANIGWMLVLLGRPLEGLEPIRAVLAATPEDHRYRPSWLCYLGVAQFDAGEGDLGADALRSTLGRDVVCIPPVERTLYLAAALALRGDVATARVLLADAQRQGRVSVAALRADAPSDDPAFLQQREALYHGLALAGLNGDASP